jgi:hypothetical protein
MRDSNPVLLGGLTAGGLISLFEAILVLGQTMMWWNLTSDQTQAWLTVIRIGLPIVVTVGTSLWVQRQTTTLSEPKDNAGAPLVREDGRPINSEFRTINRREK